ncbi:sulfatase [Luteolibacter ambystomatis]|uniref:Sulfatase n=1 Tax=Luteolibacter ambystomatis TaxID=2824561 RepID=A0A975IYM1_9BACT|nr:sulfatase [Luteolibacter ambystomatis]QUE50536.1 sulfatase [Luteolibacter ambystomatis]
MKLRLAILWLAAISASPAAERPNVLFIAVDDLRPWLGCYDPALKVSPNIDRLAATGRAFTRHYVQVPTCGASRCALMFGRRAGHLPGDGGNEASKKTAAQQPVPALPALFRANGYQAISVGKVTHYPGNHTGRDWADGPEEIPDAWDVATMSCGPWQTPEAAMHGYAGGIGRAAMKDKPLTQHVDGDDKTYPDGWIAEETVARLKEAAASGKPFFLAAGFIKPHLPFVSPKSYFEEIAGITPPVPKITTKPAFPTTWHNSNEFRGYSFNEGDPFQSDAAALTYRRAYLGCIRYTDAQVGKVLAALDASPAAGNTIVVLWGDHGWLLGEHGIWGKHCLFEEALRSPLIIRVPGQKQPGARTDAIVETVDVYPTLASYAGIPLPAQLEGASLRPQLEDPAAPSRGTAIAAWESSRTIREDRYRLVISTRNPRQVELYDHVEDPGETRNAAESAPETVARLRGKLAPPP